MTETPERLIPLSEAARLFDTDEKTVKSMVKSGSLRSLRRLARSGSPFKFRPSDVAACQRGMEVPAALRVIIAWERIDKKPDGILIEDPFPRFPRFGTATAEHYLHATYFSKAGRNFASITNAQKPTADPRDEPWRSKDSIPPGETWWFEIKFPER